MKAARATAQTVPSARTSERRDGPVREKSTTPQEVRERIGLGVGTRRTTRPSSGTTQPPRRSSSSCTRKSPAAPGRPAWVSLRLPPLGVLRPTVEQMAGVCLFVQILDALVLQKGMGNLLLEIFRLLDSHVPEQATNVPRISQDTIQQRLVDWDLRQSTDGGTVDGNAGVRVVRFPAPAAACRGDRRQSSSAWSWGFRRWKSSRFSPRPECNSAGLLSRSLTFQFLVEVFKVSAKARFQHRQPHCVALQGFFFALFPNLKKVRSPPGVPVRRCTGTSSWTPADYESRSAVVGGHGR